MELTLEQQKANRRLWVDTLRSGKYRQGAGELQDSTGAMCCLGVLADIAGCRWENRDGGLWADESRQYAPERALQFVGLEDASGDFSGGELVALNDSGASFSHIADIIESEPADLFSAHPLQSKED